MKQIFTIFTIMFGMSAVVTAKPPQSGVFFTRSSQSSGDTTYRAYETEIKGRPYLLVIRSAPAFNVPIQVFFGERATGVLSEQPIASEIDSKIYGTRVRHIPEGSTLQNLENYTQHLEFELELDLISSGLPNRLIFTKPGFLSRPGIRDNQGGAYLVYSTRALDPSEEALVSAQKLNPEHLEKSEITAALRPPVMALTEIGTQDLETVVQQIEAKQILLQETQARDLSASGFIREPSTGAQFRLVVLTDDVVRGHRLPFQNPNRSREFFAEGWKNQSQLPRIFIGRDVEHMNEVQVSSRRTSTSGPPDVVLQGGWSFKLVKGADGQSRVDLTPGRGDSALPLAMRQLGLMQTKYVIRSDPGVPLTRYGEFELPGIPVIAKAALVNGMIPRSSIVQAGENFDRPNQALPAEKVCRELLAEAAN